MTGTDETENDDEQVDEVVSMYQQDDAVGPGDAPAPESTDGEGASGDQDTQNDAQPDDQEQLETKAPIVEAGGGELEEVTGTFYVKYAQDVSVTLHEINTAQICTLVENPGFERHEIIEATLEEQPPMGVSYLVEELEEQYSIPVEQSDEALTTHVREIATEELSIGDAVAIEREGKGEIHIIRVEPAQVADTVEELHDDETTYKNAARYDHVSRVEVRTDTEAGVVSIRYMP
ncbi:DUF5812 family protein [Halovenus rubra]|uniref:DUF5812 family protein n=2 Tax=Halovenus rubra TaxID=869890 RepID=A0ABD5X8J5_9EURY|nr:DUF5812 family protein [Halovenus rubra]